MSDAGTKDPPAAVIAEHLAQLRGILVEAAPVVVAFSGGVDSSLLAWVANDELGPGAHAVTAVSPSLATIERHDAKHLADHISTQRKYLAYRPSARSQTVAA